MCILGIDTMHTFCEVIPGEWHWTLGTGIVLDTVSPQAAGLYPPFVNINERGIGGQKKMGTYCSR